MISQTLQEYFTYQDPAMVAWDALVLSHSQFAQTYYLTNQPEPVQAYWNLALVTFQPVPFDAQLPARDGQGQQDMAITVANVGNDMTSALEAAISTPMEPIRCQWTIYIEGNDYPQWEPPMDLSLTDIRLNEVQMTARATRANIFNRPFPRVLYRPDTFPGLDRR